MGWQGKSPTRGNSNTPDELNREGKSAHIFLQSTDITSACFDKILRDDRFRSLLQKSQTMIGDIICPGNIAKKI